MDFWNYCKKGGLLSGVIADISPKSYSVWLFCGYFGQKHSKVALGQEKERGA